MQQTNAKVVQDLALFGKECVPLKIAQEIKIWTY